MEPQKTAARPPRKTRSFFIVLAIVAVVAMLILPVIGQRRAEAAAAKCLVNLPTLSKAIHMYMADNDGFLPPRNPDLGDYWERPGVSGAYAVSLALSRYGKWQDMGQCPGTDHWYRTRFTSFFWKGVDTRKPPEEGRIVEPQPGTVLAVCNLHLTRGMATTFSTAWSYASSVDQRKGFHHVLRADGSVGRVDSQSVRQFQSDFGSGDVRWVDCTPYAKNHVSGKGEPVDVFPNEPWPPRWALKFKP